MSETDGRSEGYGRGGDDGKLEIGLTRDLEGIWSARRVSVTGRVASGG